MKLKNIFVVVWMVGLFILLTLSVAATNVVYLIPQQSNATYCNNTTVEIWANVSGVYGGDINLSYNPNCANVTNYASNTTTFTNQLSSHHTGWEFISFYRLDLFTGNCMIGTFTIHCNNSEGSCETQLIFSQSGEKKSCLLDDWGNELPATWINGTFTCDELSQCLGTCCNDSNCTDSFATNVTCKYCVDDLEGKYWKPNQDSACFAEYTPSDLCLNYCPQCCNGTDDDADTYIDYPSDSECTCGLDPSEWEKLPPVPELPTIFLFCAGLLALTGYVLWKKRP